MTAPAVGTHETQVVLLTTLTSGAQVAPLTSQLAELIVYAPPPARYARTKQVALLAPMTTGVQNVPLTSQLAVMIVYAIGIPGQSRSRAWSYTLDGHTFYVLNLGPEGTFVYDIVTQQWANFYTLGYGQWNMVNGCMWGSRVVAGDSTTDQVWELDPNAVLDEGWRDIEHVVTGGIAARSRANIGCAALRVSASMGKLDQVNGASMTLNFSDDWGNTWSDPFTVSLTELDYSGEIAWRSLGAFGAPGRIFQITDVGGVIRIDGCDAFLNGFDNDPLTTASRQNEG